MMNRSWQHYFVVPFLVILALFATSTGALGPCRKSHLADPKIGTPYVVSPDPGTPKSWADRIQAYEGDAFIITFNNKGNQLDMTILRKATQVHLYLIIFIYASGPNDLLLLNSGDECVGIANGETVKVPMEIQVARVLAP
jgi:hypothetical protein